jgi:cation diffusion facilitator family transporter
MSDQCCSVEVTDEHNHELKRILWTVFAINITMFLVEIVAGHIYQSTALMADSLDMLSDAFVYGVSILVVAKSAYIKAKVSVMKGVLMSLMALYVIYELITKILNPVVSNGQAITVVGLLALVANAACFWLLFKHKGGDINIRSAWVCSRNDMTMNAGVIVAGVSVVYFGSQWPDYIIGASIALLILVSSVKIIIDSVKEMKLAKESSHYPE